MQKRQMTFVEYQNTSPKDIGNNDTVVVKVAAVAGSVSWDWAAYYGPSDWTDEQVIRNGSKIGEEAAVALFRSFAVLRRYRS